MIVDFVLLVKIEINIFIHWLKMDRHKNKKRFIINLTSIVRIGEKHGN